MIDWEIFLPELSLLDSGVNRSKGGRPAYSFLLKFKMLVLQSLYNLSDGALEQQVLDRLSFMRFLGLGMGDSVPDANTIWVFRENLKAHGLVEKLFERFSDHLRQAGFSAQCGQIIDASIVKVPTRRDSREVNAKVKNGEEVEEWRPATRAQKDTTARWVQKNHKNYFGYKNHIGADVRYKLIRSYEVTPASVGDSDVFEPLLTANSDPSIYADSAYMSKDRVSRLYSSGWLPCLHDRHRGRGKRALPPEEVKANHYRSKLRVRVEHIFGVQSQRAVCSILRGIGICRARVKIGLRNLAYNLSRFVFLVEAGRGVV